MKYNYELCLYLAIALLMLMGCEKESIPDIEISNSEVELYSGETHQFQMTQDDQPIPSASIQWSSSDPMTGTVGPSGLFKAGIIGNTVVTGQYGDQIIVCEVTVMPRHELFRDPLTLMGSSMQAVKDYEERPFMEFAQYKDRLNYVEYPKGIQELTYVFEEDKLQQILINFKRTPDLHEQVVDFYKERYIYERYVNQSLFFTDRDKTISIMIETAQYQIPKPLYFSVRYVPYYPMILE